MNAPTSTLLLLGVGGAGGAAARAVAAAVGDGIRVHVADTDASAGAAADIPFTLIGGSRLAGQGSGAQAAAARAAFLDAPDQLDQVFSGVRLVIVVAALGGGTGGGASVEILKRLRDRGVATLVFATLPFGFEGDERVRTAQTAAAGVELAADAAVFLPLDDLVRHAGTDNARDAFACAAQTVVSGVSLFWRLLATPGYIHLESEQIVAALRGGGRARFVVAEARAGDGDRPRSVLDQMAASPLFGRAVHPARQILLGVLAGDDLRLSEVGAVANGVRSLFGTGAAFALGTVNDESRFAGRLVAVALAFEESGTAHGRRSDAEKALAGGSRIGGASPNVWHGEDLDVPTFLRRQLTLDR